jgi:hypothetical protein
MTLTHAPTTLMPKLRDGPGSLEHKVYELSDVPLGQLGFEGQLDLALLPRAQARRADEDSNCRAVGDGLFQGR